MTDFARPAPSPPYRKVPGVTTTATAVQPNRLLQLCARARLEGGVWNGKRTLDFYQANGFDCDLGRARDNLTMAAEKYPQLLVPVEGAPRWTYEVPENASTYFPEGALEQIADARAFIGFAREKVIGAARNMPPNDGGERQLLSGMMRILDDYEMRHESAALSHSVNEDTGRVDGMRWSLESLLWARFAGPPDEYPAEWRP